jgi:TetR/AcrR family transcriptional repressor of mexJK operon
LAVRILHRARVPARVFDGRVVGAGLIDERTHGRKRLDGGPTHSQVDGKEPTAGARRLGRPTLSNEQLLDKALEIFLEQGFERTSLDAITAAAGMAKRTVYQRYGDKNTLFKEALKRAIDTWILPIEALEAVEQDDLEETLLGIGRVLVANIMSPAGIRLLRITNAESSRLPEIGAYTYQLGTERTIVYIADLLRRRIDPASLTFDDWRQAGIAFMYLVLCGPPTMTAWGMHLDDEMIDRHTQFGVHLFLHGLLGTVAPDSAATTSAAAPSPSHANAAALSDENRRLRELLIESMLEVARLKELAAGA